MSEEITTLDDLEEAQESTKERTISELVLMDYKDMTEDEIARVVEWKAEILARESELEVYKNERQAHSEIMRARLQEIAEDKQAKFEARAQQAYDRLNQSLELRESIDALKAALEGVSDEQENS